MKVFKTFLVNGYSRVRGEFCFASVKVKVKKVKVSKTFLVNRYSRVRGEFCLSSGENVKASSPDQLSALTQVSHLAKNISPK